MTVNGEFSEACLCSLLSFFMPLHFQGSKASGVLVEARDLHQQESHNRAFLRSTNVSGGVGH